MRESCAACANFRIPHRRKPALSLPKGTENAEREFEMEKFSAYSCAAAVNSAFSDFGCSFAPLGYRRNRSGSAMRSLFPTPLCKDIDLGNARNPSLEFLPGQVWFRLVLP
jgi:hypothetical protein